MMSLVLWAALALQDPSPDEVLRKIEHELDSAKTVKVVFTSDGEMTFGQQKATFKASGTLLLKEKNRVRLDMKLEQAGQTLEIVLISDGTRVRQKFGPAPAMEGEADPKLRHLLAQSLVRVGVETAVISSLERGGLQALEGFTTSAVSHGAAEKEAKTLLFKVALPRTENALDCSLTYDPSTLNLRKRRLALKAGQVENTISESYGEFSVGPEIPDESFKLPALPAEKPAPQDDPAADVADVPSLDLRAGENPDERFFLIGPKKDSPAPPDGYRLLVALPGGDGSAQFEPFLKRIWKFALNEKYLVAQLVAVEWTPGQFNRVVWPTQKLKAEKMKFTTEEFVEAVVAAVAAKHTLNRDRIFTLSWSSGGPAAYAASLAPKGSIRGSFIAMSVFQPDWLPSLEAAKGHSYYLFQSPDDQICPLAHAEKASDLLRKNGATVNLVTYEGGHGWKGPVFANIRAGIEWLEKSRP
jgi:predicted esterase